MRLFQGCFFIIILVLSRKYGLFIRWSHWFGWFLPCSWIIWVIRKCFQWVIWGQWVQGIRRNFYGILWHTDIFVFPNWIIMTQCVFQLFLSLVYHQHHIRSLWMLIFQGEINKTGYDRLFSYHPLLKTNSNQEHNNAIHYPPFLEIIEQLVEQISPFVNTVLLELRTSRIFVPGWVLWGDSGFAPVLDFV